MCIHIDSLVQFGYTLCIVKLTDEENAVETRVTEIASGVFRLSTFIPQVEPGGLAFNQFLILGEEPLLFHTGMRGLFPLVRDAVAKLMPPEKLRWITFGHYEADECGSMNEWLADRAARADRARHDRRDGVAQRHGRPAAAHSRARRSRSISAASACAISTRRTCRTAGKRASSTRKPPARCSAAISSRSTAKSPPTTESDIVGPAIAGEDIAGYSALNPAMGATLRKLAELKPRTIALMHGPSFSGDGAAALMALADDYDRRARAKMREFGLN